MTTQIICEWNMFTQKNGKVKNKFGDNYYTKQQS